MMPSKGQSRRRDESRDTSLLDATAGTMSKKTKRNRKERSNMRKQLTSVSARNSLKTGNNNQTEDRPSIVCGGDGENDEGRRTVRPDEIGDALEALAME